MKKRRYTEETLRKIANSVTSKAQLLRALNIPPAGGNYATLEADLKRFQIDISHFTGKLWNKGKKTGYKRPLEDYLLNKVPISSTLLKKRLLAEGYLNNICSICALPPVWQGKSVEHELDHIDGNKLNNHLANLRLLCAMCHTQTPTFRGKNKRKRLKCADCKQKVSSGSLRCLKCYKDYLSSIKENSPPKIKKTRASSKVCERCSKQISKSASKCKRCAALSVNSSRVKITWPSTPTLRTLVDEWGYLEIGRRLGVSDNAIRKRLKNHQ